jgi:hypothetical protein
MMYFGIFLSGFAAASFLASAVFFLKFWRASREKLFLYFAAAFGLLGAERIVGALLSAANGYSADYIDNARSWIYLFRLLAFAALIYGIVRKHLSERA